MGAGGIGKTRLAIEAARGQIGAYTHGVYFVSLGSTSSSDFLVSAIADSLGFFFYGPHDPNVQLLNYLREKELLLVLDNFEHLLDGAEILLDMLTNAPALRLLITSRERLKLHGEWLYSLQGLAVPEAKDAAYLEAYSAPQLFIQSARRPQSDFALSEAERSAIVRLCQLVEGMPLGLELAASWVRMLSCAEIVEELAQAMGFLSTSFLQFPERHRSIRAVFDRSWNLLSADEQRVFGRLSVFQGGFRREAAERVADASLSRLSALVDKSLLHRDRGGRYQMHELLRQYAAEKLAEAPAEQAATQDGHGRYYLEFLRQQEQWLKIAGGNRPCSMSGRRSTMSGWRGRWAISQRWISELGEATQSFRMFYDAQGWYHEAVALFGLAAKEYASVAMASKSRRWIRAGAGAAGWFLYVRV